MRSVWIVGEGSCEVKICTQQQGSVLVSPEEGADPESIELVAQQVLNISLPISPSEIGSLLQEIRNTISQLDGVDVILNSTAEDLTRARDLLAKAEQAK